METVIVLIVAAGIGFALLAWRAMQARAKQKHDPIEY